MSDKHFTIIVASYNNEKWVDKNLDSITKQNYSNYNILYTNDCSTDATGSKVEEYIEKNNIKNFTLVNNHERLGAMHNIYNMIHGCDDGPDSVCLTVDGDDFLANDNVLKILNDTYQDPNVWMTYGSYLDYPGMTRGCCKPYEQYIINSGSYRKSLWRASHLRTWYVKLFKMIKKEDFMYQGDWAEAGWDILINMPALEMCNGKFKYIDEILYLYNNQNPLSDFRINLQKQGATDWFARNKPQYKAVDKLW